jgi:hypothetical protein
MTYDAKKMDFHHNSVWRLNLPTSAQGLGAYPGKVLVLERTSQRHLYRLWTLDARTPAVRLLRRRSRAAGRTGFKLRDNGTRREFGYF